MSSLLGWSDQRAERATPLEGRSLSGFRQGTRESEPRRDTLGAPVQRHGARTTLVRSTRLPVARLRPRSGSSAENHGARRPGKAHPPPPAPSARRRQTVRTIFVSPGGRSGSSPRAAASWRVSHWPAAVDRDRRQALGGAASHRNGDVRRLPQRRRRR